MNPSGTWQNLLEGRFLFQSGGQWQKTHLTKKRLARNSEQGGNTRDTGETMTHRGKGGKRTGKSQRRDQELEDSVFTTPP